MFQIEFHHVEFVWEFKESSKHDVKKGKKMGKQIMG